MAPDVPSGGGPGGGPSGGEPLPGCGRPLGAGTPWAARHCSYAPWACGWVELLVTEVLLAVVDDPGEVEFDEQAAANATMAARAAMVQV